MYVLKVNGNTYKVAYSYKTLVFSDILDRIQKVLGDAEEGETVFSKMKDMLKFVPELLLYGLQKNHKEQFGFETEEEKAEQLDKVYDLIDDYEDEHSTDEVAEGEMKPDAFTIFSELMLELESKGFLSRLSAQADESAEKVDATVIPMDHQKKVTKKKVGVKA